MKAKFNGLSPEQVLQMGVEAVQFASSISEGHPGASIEFSAEAATTTREAYLERVVREAIIAGADIINVPDTVGQKNPLWMHNFYKKVISWCIDTNPDVTISAHNHNDLGNAVANTYSLVAAASELTVSRNTDIKIQAETTVCGLGERAGNTDIYPFVAGLFKFSDELEAEITWSFNPLDSVSTANTILEFAGISVDRQSPIVGNDINTHRSGIHSDGVIKGGHQIYTPTTPTFWGHAMDARHENGQYQGKAGRAAANG